MSYRKLLSKFSWLAVKCVADSAAATSTPVCLGVCKPMIAASVSSDHNFIRSAAVRHSIAMGMPSAEQYHQSSLHRRRVHIKQCFPTSVSMSKATLPQDGLQMIPSCRQEELEEISSFEMDQTVIDMDEQFTQPSSSEDTQQRSEAITHSSLQHLQIPSPHTSAFTDMVDNILMPASPTVDDDSSLDDEEEYTMLINQGILRPHSTDPSEDYIRMVPPVIGRFTNGSRGDGDGRDDHEDIYPFAWALDGRNVNDTGAHNHARPTTPLVCPSVCVFVCMSVTYVHLLHYYKTTYYMYFCLHNFHCALDDNI